MAVVAVCSHRVRGFGIDPNIAAECFCGWRMGSLTKQSLHDAGHLHYALEGARPIVFLLRPVDRANAVERAGLATWAESNVEQLIYGTRGLEKWPDLIVPGK